MYNLWQEILAIIEFIFGNKNDAEPVAAPMPAPIPPAPTVPPPAPVVIPPAPTPPAPEPIDTLIHAVVMVESGGAVNVMGDLNIANHAYGCCQIRYGVLGEVNAYWGTHHTLQELLGVNGCLLSKQICKTYFTKILPKQVGRPISFKECARGWNGGLGAILHQPVANSTTEKQLEQYWALIQKHL